MAMDERAREVMKIGEHLFSKKQQIDSLNQEIALNFYPERADFTEVRNQGSEFADHAFSSYAFQARQELGNLLSASLRPRGQKWFSLHVEDEHLDAGDEERLFLDHLRDIQWRAMYDHKAQFVRATKQADHDFASFGNAVIKFGPNLNADGLLFQNFHLRDCAWAENAENMVDALWRKWNPTARNLVRQFKDKVAPQVMRCCEKEPEKEIKCKHIVVPQRMYDYRSKRTNKEFPFVSLYVDCENETVLEEVPLNYFCYNVPRWQTVAGSQYGISMATMILLPDGRTIQVMVRTIREAGEKYVDPPMVAITDAIRGDIALYAGGITTADMEYDERLGEVLRPITQDKSGFPISQELLEAIKGDIRKGFFLDKIQLPESDKVMTATEVTRRFQEHIVAVSPLFEPIEVEYNDPLCEGVFRVLSDYGAFPFDAMPESLAGMPTRFRFRSPLADMAEQREAETFVDVYSRILIPAAQIDEKQKAQANMTVATREAMRAAGWKEKWFAPIEAVAEEGKRIEKQQAMAQGATAMHTAGAIAEQGGKGIAAVQQAIEPQQAAGKPA
jgi:hypothetical protein